MAKTDSLAGSTKSLRARVSKLRVYSVSHSLPWLDASGLRRLENIVTRLEYMDLKPTKRAKPATAPIVELITNNHAVHPLLRIMIVTAHDGLLRGAELCSGIKVRDLDWNHDQSVVLHLHRSKCCRKGGGEFVKFVNYRPNCAADLLYQYMQYYKLWRYPDALLFPKLKDNVINPEQPMSVNWFRSAFRAALRISGVDPNGFGTHSLRAGGATDLFKAGVSYPNIKKYGRWKTDTALIYYRDTDAVVEEVFQGFKRIAKKSNLLNY